MTNTPLFQPFTVAGQELVFVPVMFMKDGDQGFLTSQVKLFEYTQDTQDTCEVVKLLLAKGRSKQLAARVCHMMLKYASCVDIGTLKYPFGQFKTSWETGVKHDLL